MIEYFWHTLQNSQAQQLGIWNYFLFGLIVVIEGPLATLLGAAAASAGFLQVKAVFLAATLGNLMADLGWYWVGYAGKVAWVLRIGQRFGLRQHHLNHAQQGFEDQAPLLLILAKFTAALTIPTLVAAGLAKLPFKRWLPAYILAEAVWTGLLVVIGFYATGAILNVERGLQSLGIASAAAFAVIAILLVRRSMQKRQASINESDS